MNRPAVGEGVNTMVHEHESFSQDHGADTGLLLERLAQLEREVGSLRAQIAQPPAATPDGRVGQRTAIGTDGTTPSRRSLLKMAGISAAAMLAAGTLATQKETVEATDNLPLLLGAANDANNTAATTTKLSPVGGTTPAVLLSVANVGSGVGISGSSVDGTGVIATSSTGVALQINGSGRFRQLPAAFSGKPTTGIYSIGEYVMDSFANLYICTTSGSGSNPGNFKRVVSLLSSYKGGAVYFLSSPIRVLDSRAGSGSPLTAPSPVPGNSTILTLTLAGATVNGVSFPGTNFGAIAAIGNITAVSPTGAGDIRLFPAGGAVPTVSNLNYVERTTVANSFVVPINQATGQLAVQVDGADTDLIIDLSGFVQ